MNETSGDPFNSTGAPQREPQAPEPSSPEPQGPEPQLPTAPLLPMPKLWIGYALAAATFGGEMIAIARHPELLQSTPNAKELLFGVPPLEVFLPGFVAAVYWLVCIYRYHKILAALPNYKHPISPARAVGFHFIPLFWLVWLFLWPREIAKFVNARFKMPLMRGWIFGVGTIGAMLCQIALDPALGIALMFLSMAYVGGFLSRALAVPQIRLE